MTAKTGVLVANLGTPDAPTPEAVKRFLAEFLSDRRVVDLPPALWLPVLYGVILHIRPKRSARAYREIWTDSGSPLLVNTLAIADALERRLASLLPAPVAVATGMTYGNPSIAAALEELRAHGVARVLVLPLYPQYSATTTASVFDRLEAALASLDWRPEVLRVDNYHADAGYVAALAESLAGRIADFAAGVHLLFSFHGLPQRYVDAGDPYQEQCQMTARLVAARLALPADAWSVAYQSRVGGARWLKPYTENRLRALATQDPRRIVVCCPGFAVDCLETLEEIAIRGRASFLAAGGASFDYVPALNDSPVHVECLAQIAAGALARDTLRAAP
ncbi:MAG: Ferrochelatase [Steroidobacteraceae bacterium]|nr:Ferrochelatase [Steroidobacteraceae bacterium]MBM2854801.1 Ferrochelatase [Steroidobacteraceae bacterium]